MNFHTISNAHEAQGFSYGGMTNFIDFPDQFRLRIDNPVLMLKEGWQTPAGNIAVLINSGGQNSAAIFPVPDRVVRTTAKEGDTKRSPANNHLLLITSLANIFHMRFTILSLPIPAVN